MQSDWPRAFSYITWERFSQNMQFLENGKDNCGGSSKPKIAHHRIFCTTGDMRRGHSPHPSTSQNLVHFTPPGKILLPPTMKFLSPQPKVNPPTKKQSSSYNPIKTAFLAVGIAPTTFLFSFLTLWTHRSC